MIPRPLTGQILVRILPSESQTTSGIHLPDVAHIAAQGEKARAFKAVVLRIGPWKKSKNGFGFLPPFGVGATVIVSPYSGTKLTRNIGENMMLVASDDVIAMVDEQK